MVGLPGETDVGSKDNEFLSIHEDLFHIILAMHQNYGISPRIIVKDISLTTNKYSQYMQSIKTQMKIDMVKPCHNFKEKLRKL